MMEPGFFSFSFPSENGPFWPLLLSTKYRMGMLTYLRLNSPPPKRGRGAIIAVVEPYGEMRVGFIVLERYTIEIETAFSTRGMISLPWSRTLLRLQDLVFFWGGGGREKGWNIVVIPKKAKCVILGV